jgi:7-cyano-7-deazaguanine reductase
MSDTTKLNVLGSGTSGFENLATEPSSSILETFESQHQDNQYVVAFECFEFTSICPKTKQRDFAEIYINYIPNKLCVESKSLKLYLASFANHGEFMEDCTNRIMKDLIKVLEPEYIEVYSDFNSRGGIFDRPFCNYYKTQENAKIASILDRYHAIRN